MANEIYIAVSRTDGSVVHVAFQTFMRCPVSPGGPWRPVANGWERDSSDANIEFELARFNRMWANAKDETGLPAPDPTMISWRRLSQAEHEMFNQNRHLRGALEDVGGKIQHNMPKARELHREHLRHYNGDKLIGLDREWVNASVEKNKAKIDAVEAKRKELADSVVDPRIDAAQTVEELLQVKPVEV